MPRKNIPDAKSRILEAAIKVFAKKSFEGSRVDEIAKEAGVPKSVIYYHFRSKDEILEFIIKNFLNTYLQLISVAEKDTHQSKADELPGRIRSQYTDFQEKNQDIIRIILIESLKKSNEKPVIFKIVEAIIEKESTFSTLNKSTGYNKQERLVAEFFTNIIPNYSYMCFREAWINHFGIKQENLDQLFTKVFMASHGAYHKYHE